MSWMISCLIERRIKEEEEKFSLRVKGKSVFGKMGGGGDYNSRYLK